MRSWYRGMSYQSLMMHTEDSCSCNFEGNSEVLEDDFPHGDLSSRIPTCSNYIDVTPRSPLKCMRVM